jgi:hypothetical protein
VPLGTVIVNPAEWIRILGVRDSVAIPVEIAVAVDPWGPAETAGLAGIESCFEFPVVSEAVPVRVVFLASWLELRCAGVGDHGDARVAIILNRSSVGQSCIPVVEAVFSLFGDALVPFCVGLMVEIRHVVIAVLDVFEHRERARGHGLPGGPDALLVAGGADGEEEGSDDEGIGTHFLDLPFVVLTFV